MADLYESALQAAKVLAEQLAPLFPGRVMANALADLRNLPQVTADMCAEDLDAFVQIERTLADVKAWKIDGQPLRWSADFDDYEQELKAAKLRAKESYVHYRSIYDALNELPVLASDADAYHLDTLEQHGGELEDLFATDFWI